MKLKEIFQKQIQRFEYNQNKILSTTFNKGDVICGLNSNFGHDKAYCILKNGEILEHIELERHDRIKGSNRNHLRLLYENCKYIDEIITAIIDIFLFKLSFSFKKIYPKKTFNIGKIKYP